MRPRFSLSQSAREFAIVVFAALALYVSSPGLQIGDSRYTLAISDILVRTGAVDLRPLISADRRTTLAQSYACLVKASDLPETVRDAAVRAGVPRWQTTVGPDYYPCSQLVSAVPEAGPVVVAGSFPLLPFFPVWPSILATPASALTLALGIPVFDGVTFDEARNARYQRWLAAALSALSVGFFYATARSRLGRPWALGLAAWLAAGLLLSSASRALWTDTFALPLCFAGLFLANRAILSGRAPASGLAAAAVALSLAFMMKPVYALPAALIGLLVVLSPGVGMAAKAVFVATGALCGLVFVASSYAQYGLILPPYFTPSRTRSADISSLAGVLVSPGRGILWYMPSALLLCLTPWLVRRDLSRLIASLLAVAVVAAAIPIIAGFPHWWAGWSFGPRVFQFALPAVAVLGLLAAEATSGKGGRARIAALALFSAIAGWEALVHFSSAQSARSIAWDAIPIDVDQASWRLWDWSDPQFLAAFAERRAAQDIGDIRRELWPASCADLAHAADTTNGAHDVEWNGRPAAELRFAAPPTDARLLTIELRPLGDGDAKERLRFDIDAVEIGTAEISGPGWTTLRFNIPERATEFRLAPGVRVGVDLIRLTLLDPRLDRAGRQPGLAIRNFSLSSQALPTDALRSETCP